MEEKDTLSKGKGKPSKQAIPLDEFVKVHNSDDEMDGREEDSEQSEDEEESQINNQKLQRNKKKKKKNQEESTAKKIEKYARGVTTKKDFYKVEETYILLNCHLVSFLAHLSTKGC